MYITGNCMTVYVLSLLYCKCSFQVKGAFDYYDVIQERPSLSMKSRASSGPQVPAG